jgi:enolase 1/2/3
MRLVVPVPSPDPQPFRSADLSGAITATQIETGSLCRWDRVAKYNRPLYIEDELGGEVIYGGRAAIPVPARAH